MLHILLVTGYQTCVTHKSRLVFVCYSDVTGFRSSEMWHCVVRKVSKDEGTVLPCWETLNLVIECHIPEDLKANHCCANLKWCDTLKI
jgi:hypothetical protein